MWLLEWMDLHERRIFKVSKIGFCGTHSTGKSTLVECLRTERILTNYYFDINITRWIKSLGFNINLESTPAAQELNLLSRIARLNSFDNLVADRTIIDVLAYSMHVDSITTEQLELQQDLVERNIRKYDIIFYIPPETNLVDDGTRLIDDDFRRNIDNKILELLEFYNVDYIEIRGSVRERLQTILNIIEGDNVSETT